MSHGTPSDIGGYIQFQTEVLRQLPRPSALDADVIDGWMHNRAALKSALQEALVPARTTSGLKLLKKQVHLEYIGNGYIEFEAFSLLYRKGIVVNSFNSREDLIRYWPHESQNVQSVTLRVYEVTENLPVIEAFRALGARNSTEWADVYRLLKSYESGKGDLVRNYKGNYFFINGRLIQVGLNDDKKWVIIERPVLPGHTWYHDFWKGARVFVR